MDADMRTIYRERSSSLSPLTPTQMHGFRQWVVMVRQGRFIWEEDDEHGTSGYEI